MLDYQERRTDDTDNLAPAHSQDDNDFKPQKAKVQFPDDLAKAPHMTYPYDKQDPDASSPHASSVSGPEDDDSEDYDWSDEEDLVDEEASFEKRMGVKMKHEGFGFKRVISILFSSLIGSTFLAALLVLPGILVQIYWYKPHPTEHRSYVKDNVQAWLFWAAANLLVSWCIAMIIDIIPVLFRYLISATWGHVSEFVKTRIEIYDSVKGTAKPAFYAAAAYASWVIIFVNIYELHDMGKGGSRATYTDRLAQAVQFFFFLILIWCIQQMLSHLIAFSFHRTAYRERIENVEQALNVIEKLRAYRPKRYNHQKNGSRTHIFSALGFTAPLSDRHFNKLSSGLRNNSPPQSRPGTSHGHDEGNDGDTEDMDRTLVNQREGKRSSRHTWFEDKTLRQDSRLGESNQGHGGGDAISSSYESSPNTPSRLNPHRYPPVQPNSRTNSPRPSVDEHATPIDPALKQAAKVLKNAVLHDARNLTGNDEDQGSKWNVNSSHEAKRLARSIWMRFKDRGRTWLVPSDFYPAFADQASAEEAFRVFDKDNNGDLSRAEIKTTLLKVYKERRLLSRSMRDVGEALKTLNNILLFFAGIVLFFISLSVFGLAIGNSLSSLYTLVIAASFIFKNAASSAFDSIMFLFVTHPYDTGDRVFVDLDNLVVKRVGLFATIFVRSDGTETYYFNSQLFNKFITNVRRSGKTFENLTMQVAWRTPLVKLDALEKCLNEWLSTEENRWFEPSTNIVLQHIGHQRYLELTIGIGHNGNWQDWGLRNARKTAFHAAVQYYCRQLGIIGYEAPLPVVWANPSTMAISPTLDGNKASPISDTPVSPHTEHERMQEAMETENAAKNMKATLGFLPPLTDRSSRLTRARKSKNRKAAIGAGNG